MNIVQIVQGLASHLRRLEFYSTCDRGAIKGLQTGEKCAQIDILKTCLFPCEE